MSQVQIHDYRVESSDKMSLTVMTSDARIGFISTVNTIYHDFHIALFCCGPLTTTYFGFIARCDISANQIVWELPTRKGFFH